MGAVFYDSAPLRAPVEMQIPWSYPNPVVRISGCGPQELLLPQVHMLPHTFHLHGVSREFLATPRNQNAHGKWQLTRFRGAGTSQVLAC